MSLIIRFNAVLIR